MDELFAMKLWPWQWQSAVTTGVGSAVARAEQNDPSMEKGGDIEHVSQGSGFTWLPRRAATDTFPG
jgi:hypothetical protein